MVLGVKGLIIKCAEGVVIGYVLFSVFFCLSRSSIYRYRRRRALSTCENVLGRVEYLLGLGMRLRDLCVGRVWYVCMYVSKR